MGVSIVEGNKVERIAQALESIDQYMTNQNGNVNLSDLVIADRNILTTMDWGTGSIGSNGATYRYTSIFELTPNVAHALWVKPSGLETPPTVTLVLYDDTNTIRLNTVFNFDTDNQIRIISPRSYYKKAQIGVLPATTDEAWYKSIFFGQITSGENMSDVELQYIRKKLNTMSVDEVDDMMDEVVARTSASVSDAIKYSPQVLTADQQQQARNNISAISGTEVNNLVTGVVKYTSQSLTDEQKAQTRDNIGAISSEEVNGLVTGVVKYSEQTLNASEKQQARENIGAAGADEVDSLVTGAVRYTLQNLTSEQQEQARDNIGAAAASLISGIQLDVNQMKSNVADVTKSGDVVTVTYANNTSSNFTIEAGGTAIKSVVYDENHQLHFYDENDRDLFKPITIQGGGGGGTTGGTAYITRITEAGIVCVQGESVNIQYTLVAKDASGEDARPGTSVWSVNGSQVATNIQASVGVNAFDVGPYLQPGTNTVEVAVSIDVGNESLAVTKKSWTINAVNMYFTWNYDSSQVNKSAFKDNWVAYGSILKSMHTVIDDKTALELVTSNKSNVTQSIDIPMQTHGAHSIEHWLTAMVGDEVKQTAKQYREAIFDDGVTKTPIIALSAKQVEVDQYTTFQLGAVVYTPDSLTSDAELYVDGVKQGAWNDVDRTMQYWAFTPTSVNENAIISYKTIQDEEGHDVQVPTQWMHQLSIATGTIPRWTSGSVYYTGEKVIVGENGIAYVCTRGNADNAFDPTKWQVLSTIDALGLTVRTAEVIVNALDLSVEEVSGYSFRFKSSDMASNSAVQNWNSNGVTATFSNNFDWENGGLQTEMVDEYLMETNSGGTLQQYLGIKAGTRMTINHKLFGTDPKTTGMTFKIVFKIKNCRNYNALIAQCYNGSTGIRLFAHEAVFNGSGHSISIPYDENAYMELEMDLYPSTGSSASAKTTYMLGWLDGVMTTCRTYESTDMFVHASGTATDIVLGSDDCDLNIYMVKAYPFLMDTDSNISNHMSNFIMDAPNTAEMIRRYERNDILGENNEISYIRLRDQNPDLRVWLYDIPYMTNGKKDRVGSTGVKPKFEQFWTNGGNYYHLTGEGLMSIQGTSSVNYILGAANTDFNFTTLRDGDGNDLLAHGTKDDSYGGSNNWYYEDELNPGHAKVYTAAEALEESGGELGPEWVVIERTDDAARTPTKYIKALGMKINDDSCPITYANTKVNFASCEQVNNMCNAMWYQRYNPYPSLTARDCMEFSMGVQFIKDAGNIPDNQHFTLFDDRDNYHMYSIANMGNSKKNVHVFHDLSNENEVCIEVKDSTEPQHRMITNDLSNEKWDGDGFFEMRYPDTKNPRQEIKDAWQRLVTWFASNNPGAATGERLAEDETYEDYIFKGHQRPGNQVLRGTRITQYSGTYQYDTKERRIAKMLSECEDYLVMDSIVYHFVYLERHTMVDNVAKNNFWSSTDLIHWDMSKAYDMDTSDGNDNQGKLVLDYGMEYNDTNPTDSKAVFNGSDSVWFVFVANLYEACQTMFQYCETRGAWSASAYHKFLLDMQRKVPERCWNQCYWYSYLRPHEKSITSEWLKFLDGGQKTHQRRHFEQFQELYISTKYHGLSSTSQRIILYAYNPADWGGIIRDQNGAALRNRPSLTAAYSMTIPYGSNVKISERFVDTSRTEWRKITYNGTEGYILLNQIDSVEPNGEITLTMYSRMYISVDNGTHTMTPIRVTDPSVPYVVNFSEGGSFSNAMIYVNTASMVQAIEGIEQLYITEGRFDDAVRLREVTVGSPSHGYYNTNLRQLSFTNNTMLERLYAQNLTNINTGLDLKNCQALQYIDTTGSTFTSYEFANGGLLETAILQSPVTISMRNLAKLNDWSIETNKGLKILDYSKITGVIYENVPGVNSLDLVNAAVNLAFARLLGILWTMDRSGVLSRLYNMNGYGENGGATSRAVLGGKVKVATVSSRELTIFQDAWSPDLEITYDNIVTQHPVRFVNPDGSSVNDRTGSPYIQYIDNNKPAYDPVEAGEIDAPVLPPSKQYTYTFAGWTGLDGLVLGEKVVTANYTETLREYTVRWFLKPTATVPDRVKVVRYGEAVMYDAENPYYIPTNTESEEFGYYQVFAGWNKSTGHVEEDIDVYAVWEGANIPAPGLVMLEDMSPAQIYGVAKRDAANEYWEEKDHFDMDVGIDFDFENVESEMLCQNRYFDRTNMLATDLALFDVDAESFTLAIDFEFNDTEDGATLISCYDPSSMAGFKISTYTNTQRARLTWGNQVLDSAATGVRCMLVMRHQKGSNALYVAYNGPTSTNFQYASSVTRQQMNRSSYLSHSGKLTFGGILNANNRWTNTARGWIHWCKIWYDDLGTTAVQQLAAWPHEIWRFAYAGANKYYLAGSSLSSSASFIATRLLPYDYFMKSTGENSGGWRDSTMRTFLNTMCINAVPYRWRSIFARVSVPSLKGGGSSDLVRSGDGSSENYNGDWFYLPAYSELGGTSSTPYINEGTAISWFTNAKARTYFNGFDIPEDSVMYTSTEDPATQTDIYPNFKEGDIWYRSNGGSYGSGYYWIYVSAENAAKHRYISQWLVSGVTTSVANYSAVMKSDAGGYWVARQYYYWTRTPYYTNTSYFYYYQGNYQDGWGNGSNSSYYSIMLCFSI